MNFETERKPKLDKIVGKSAFSVSQYLRMDQDRRNKLSGAFLLELKPGDAFTECDYIGFLNTFYGTNIDLRSREAVSVGNRFAQFCAKLPAGYVHFDRQHRAYIRQ